MTRPADEDRLDAALERLAGFGPDLTNGMTSHAPMVVEALSVLGRGDAADRWIDAHAASLTPRPGADPGDGVADWRTDLDHRLARLAPGAAGAAMHGLIRTGHAVRGLRRRDNPVRRAELAAALAMWTASYKVLPGAAGPVSDGLHPDDALARVAFLPAPGRRNGGSITAALAALEGHAPFAGVIDLLEIGDDIEARVADLVDLFARVFLANAVTPLGAVVFTHGVTVFAAVGNVAPALSLGTARTLLRHAWQAAAALYAAYGDRPPAPAPEAGPRPWPGLIDDAVASGDDHVIKLTEACLTWGPRGSTAPAAAAERAAMLIAN